MVRDAWSEPNDDGKTEWWTAIDGADVTVLLRLSDLSEYAHEAVDKMRRAIAGVIERDRAGRPPTPEVGLDSACENTPGVPKAPWNTCPKCHELVDIDEDNSDGGEVHCRACDTYLILESFSDDSWALRNPDDDREELHDKDSDVRLIIKPDADPAEMLAVCAKLLDLDPPGYDPGPEGA